MILEDTNKAVSEQRREVRACTWDRSFITYIKHDLSYPSSLLLPVPTVLFPLLFPIQIEGPFLC